MSVVMPILMYLLMFLGGCFLLILLAVLPVFCVAVGYFLKCRFVDHREIPRSSTPTIKQVEPSLLKKIFWLFPRRFVEDIFTSDPDSFPLHGCCLFVGGQGKGKTIALAHYVRMLKKMYPNVSVFSNIALTYANGVIHSIDDIIQHQSIGRNGKIEIIDECQNWFNSNESRNFPPEMLSEICQQRKQYSLLLMTTQVYNNLVSQIKSQIDTIFNPITILGCFTIVRVYKVTRDENGQIVGQVLHKVYSFVHDDELRNSYNTREKVQRLAKKGFKRRSEQLNIDNEKGA